MLRKNLFNYLPSYRQSLKLGLTKRNYFFFSSPLRTPNNQSRNILITSALPYVNNTPHLGNIIGAILSADTYSRYCRMRGYNSLFICGTDEYGTTTQVKALTEKTSPQQICDRYYKLHKEVYDWFQISFDYFGRTSMPVHSQVTNQIFKYVWENGYVDVKEGLEFFCEGCKICLADRYVVGECGKCGAVSKGDQCDACSTIYANPITQLSNPKCSICSTKPIIKQTKHSYLKLSKCEPMLRRWLMSQPGQGNGMKNWSNNAKAVTKAWINSGIQDRCISRSLNWGVPIPQKYLEGNKVFYVWFDAPIGYISITKAALGQKWKQWWQPTTNKVQLVQFMGKDNIAFHSIMFPSTLHSTSLPFIKPDRLSVTQYLLYEGGKFSKSNKIGIFGDDCKTTNIKSDVWRYYLLLSRPQTYDTQFLWQDLAIVNKKDLMNTLGNMFLRILKYTYSNLGNNVPEVDCRKYTELEINLISSFSLLIKKYCDFMENTEIKGGCHVVLEMGQVFNKYIQDSEFWSKKNVAQARNLTVVGLALRILEFYAIFMEPFIPNTTKQILHTLSLTSQTTIKLPKNIDPHTFFKQMLTNPQIVQNQNKRWSLLKLNKPEIFFEDISDKSIQQFKKKYGVNQRKKKEKEEQNLSKVGQESEEKKSRDANDKKKDRKQKKQKKKMQKKSKKEKMQLQKHEQIGKENKQNPSKD